MTTALVLPDQDPAVLGYRQQAEAFKREALALQIVSPEAQKSGIILLATGSRVVKDAEARRAGYVKPLNDHVKQVNDLFRQVLAPIVEGDRVLRQRLLTWDQEERRRAADAAAKAEREQLEAEALLKEAEKAEQAGRAGVADALLTRAVAKEEGAKVAETQAAPPPRTTSTPFGASTLKRTWTFKVVDPALIPRGYLLLDEPGVRQAIRAGVREIPGIEIFQEESLAVKG